MNHLYHEKYLGYDIYIFPDDDPLHPRWEYDNLGALILHDKHGWYIGDKDHSTSIETAKEYFQEMDYDEEGDYVPIPLSLEAEAKLGLVLPVYYRSYGSHGCKLWCDDHHCLEWDEEGGQSGWIWADAKAILREFGSLNEDAMRRTADILKGEIEVLGQYFNGEVYGYTVSRHDEELESCWGYFGDYDEYCLPEARDVVRAVRERRVNEYRAKKKIQAA